MDVVNNLTVSVGGVHVDVVNYLTVNVGVYMWT